MTLDKMDFCQGLAMTAIEMKKFRFFKIIIAVMMLISYYGCSGQNTSSEKQALEMIEQFYTEYITQVAEGAIGADGEKKIYIIQEKYCTKALLGNIPKIIEKTEYDPFLKAQDINIECLQTLSVTKDSAKANTYIVSYVDEFIKPDRSIKKIVNIYLTLVREKDGYKINAVW